MIAAGLCLMGGCFAQDESSAAVDTYWPAHSVHVEGVDYTLLAADGSLTTPFYADGIRYGGIAENVQALRDSADTIMGWGVWTMSVFDALYLGCRYKKPHFFIKHPDDQSSTLTINENPGNVVDCMYMQGDRESVMLGAAGVEKRMSLPKANTTGVNNCSVRLKGSFHTWDVVSYWFSDPVRGRYFMAQPLCSVNGDEAVFLHGFNTLTEI